MGGRTKRSLLCAVALALAVTSTSPVASSPYQGAPYLWVMDGDGSDAQPLAGSLRGQNFDVHPITGDVAFAGSSHGFAPQDIWIVLGTGSDPINITSSDIDENLPAWSPTEPRVSFVSEGKLFAVNRDGSARTEIASLEGYRITEHEWSPDGRQIAFIAVPSNTHGTGGLYVVDSGGGSEVTRLVDRDVKEDAPTWSPDSSTIAFITQDLDLHTISASGGDEVDVTDEVEAKNNPRWSPDGTEILFDTFYGLYVVEADGDNLRPMGTGRYGQWSNEATRIVYEENSAVSVIDADGHNKRNLTYTGESYEDNEYRPQFTPDGRIVYLRGVWEGVPRTYSIERSVDYEIEDHTWFRGRVRAQSPCRDRKAPIRVARKLPGGEWKVIIRFETGPRGRFRFPIEDRPGAYRAYLRPVSTRSGYDSVTCLAVKGPTIRHVHR